MRINVIGKGFVEFDAKVNIAFKKSNQQGTWGKMGVGRTCEFSVPATRANRMLFGFADDPSEYGDAMRKRHAAEMQYSGGSLTGSLTVCKFGGGRFSCVFFYPSASGLDVLDGKKLADCKCTVKGVTWSEQNTHDADDPVVDSVPAALVRYKRPARQQQLSWPCLPSLSMKLYIENILDNLGVGHRLDIPRTLRIVTPTLKSSPQVYGYIRKTGLTAGTIDASLSNYLDFKTDAELSRWDHWFGIVTHTPCWAIRPKADIEVVWPLDFPADGELLQLYGNSITPVTDRYRDAGGWHGQPLAGRTTKLSAGQWFFVVTDSGSGYGDSYLTGWSSDASPFALEVGVAVSGNIAVGDVWMPSNNAPDMTVVEYLRSAALMLGKELFWDEDTEEVVIADSDVGSNVRKPLASVVEMVETSRKVVPWGEDTGSEAVVFDSEEYVTQPLRRDYVVNNGTLTAEVVNTIKWSEGNVNDDGEVVIHDTEVDGETTKLTAKKWTVGVTGQGDMMARVALEDYGLASVLSRNATSAVLRVLMDVDDFMRMSRDALYHWRGMWYVWTDASWSDGVATLTLQVY